MEKDNEEIFEWILQHGKEQVYANTKKDVYIAVMVNGNDAHQKGVDEIVNGVGFLWNTEDDDFVETNIRVIDDDEEIKKLKEKIKEIKQEE